MSFWQFIRGSFAKAFHVSWHVADIAHLVIVILEMVFFAVALWFGLKPPEEHPKVGLVLLGVVFLFFCVSLALYGYRLYRGEYDKRANRERQLSSDWAIALRKRINSLPVKTKAAVKQMVIERRLGGRAVQKDFPGVDFFELSGQTAILTHEPIPVDVWSIRTEYLDLLREIFIPTPEANKLIGKRPSLLSRLFKCFRRWERDRRRGAYRKCCSAKRRD